MLRANSEGFDLDGRCSPVAGGYVSVLAPREEDYEVRIAAPSKKKLHFVVHDFEPGYDTYTEKPGYRWDADIAFGTRIHRTTRPW